MRNIAMLLILFTGGLSSGSGQPATHYPKKPQNSQLSEYESRLDRRVERFDAAGRTLISNVLDLAYENELPIGIEYVDHEIMQPISLSLNNQTVREILVEIVQQAPQYRISFSGGLVDLYVPKAREDSTNLLNTSIKDFAVVETDTHKADFELFCALNRELALQASCVGSIALGQWGPLKITVNMRNARVYEILNAIVAQNGRAVWTVTAPPEKLAEVPVGGLWHIYSLDGPFKDVVSDRLNSMVQ